VKVREGVDSRHEIRYNKKNNSTEGEDNGREENYAPREEISVRLRNNSRESLSVAVTSGTGTRSSESDTRGRSRDGTQEKPLPQEVRENALSVYETPIKALLSFTKNLVLSHPSTVLSLVIGRSVFLAEMKRSLGMFYIPLHAQSF